MVQSFGTVLCIIEPPYHLTSMSVLNVRVGLVGPFATRPRRRRFISPKGFRWCDSASRFYVHFISVTVSNKSALYKLSFQVVSQDTVLSIDLNTFQFSRSFLCWSGLILSLLISFIVVLKKRIGAARTGPRAPLVPDETCNTVVVSEGQFVYFRI